MSRRRQPATGPTTPDERRAWRGRGLGRRNVQRLLEDIAARDQALRLLLVLLPGVAPREVLDPILQWFAPD